MKSRDAQSNTEGPELSFFVETPNPAAAPSGGKLAFFNFRKREPIAILTTGIDFPHFCDAF